MNFLQGTANRTEPVSDMSEQNSIKDYIEGVEKLAELKSEIIFNNTKANLAAVVMATILKFSNSEIRIYDADLNGDIADTHGSFIKELGKALFVGKKIKVALQKCEPNESRIFEKFCEFSKEYPKNLDVRIVNDDFKSNIRDVFKKDIFITVGDYSSYRMQTNSKTDEKMKAICCFNGESVASKLVVAFNKNFNVCEKVKFPILEANF